MCRFVLLYCLVAMLTVMICVTASATCVKSWRIVASHLLGIANELLCVEVVCAIGF